MAQPAARGGALTRWARFASKHPKRVIAGWFVILLIAIGLATTVGGTFVNSFKIPGAESQKALDLLNAKFPSAAGDSATMVFESAQGVNNDAIKTDINELLGKAKTLPNVVAVDSPYESQGAISRDGTIAYATIQYDRAANDLSADSIKALTNLSDDANYPNMKVEVGGEVVAASEFPTTGSSEIIGIIAAVIILLITFGSVVAMGLPIVNAIIGVMFGFLAATIAAAVFDLSTITTAFISMIGLGVGIDYSLFIVTRFREARSTGLSVQNSVVTAVDTAGRAVIFAGTIVVIALLGLFTVGIPFVGFMGASGALVVFLSVLVANGLLPAILSLVGKYIDKWTLPIPTAKPTPTETTFGYRLVSAIQRRPLVWLVGALAIVLTIASPVLQARVGSADAGNNPTSMHTRRAYDLLAKGFGPGFNGPLLVVVNKDGGVSQETLTKLHDAMGSAKDAVFVSNGTLNKAGDTAIMTVIPRTAPQDKETEDLIHELRSHVIPDTLNGTGAHAYVGGGTAAFVDISEKISHGLPIFILVVAGLSILILMVVFRSIVVPLKAALLNLLSFLAAYGMLVAVFQKGWGASLIGVDRTGPIESFLPLILFGILFGLSMDYEVFLISRVRESFNESGDNRWALSHGIGMTGRVIIAAGSIMVAVFGSFILGDSRTIKEFGVGLASAIFVDVVFVRMIIVPAVMTLIHNNNWWFPAKLDKALPRLDIEGADAHHQEHAQSGLSGAATAD